MSAARSCSLWACSCRRFPADGKSTPAVYQRLRSTGFFRDSEGDRAQQRLRLFRKKPMCLGTSSHSSCASSDFSSSDDSTIWNEKSNPSYISIILANSSIVILFPSIINTILCIVSGSSNADVILPERFLSSEICHSLFIFIMCVLLILLRIFAFNFKVATSGSVANSDRILKIYLF